MKETLSMLNRMQADGIIDAYAIGGAVGATFYLEPVATMDIDVFVSFRSAPDSMLISLSPLFAYLKSLGCEARGEYVMMGGWPVQFLPPADALGEEALAEAEAVDVEGVPTRVMKAEHLAALALQLGRAKDHARVLQFVEAGVLDPARLESVLSRHGLLEKWTRFERRYIEDLP